MTLSRTILRICAVAAILAAAVLVPAAAQAHTGHHAGHHAGHQVQLHHPLQPHEAQADPAARSLQAEVRSHVGMPAQGTTDPACGDRGCCASGHCTACFAAMLPLGSAPWPATSGSAPISYAAPAVLSAGVRSLRRPPKSPA